ncbi:hypothetical protein SAMN05421823_104374 [Catalinimonas alkaloidigena]|uniref:Heat induced stress protein YflT n=1 Tax=Catalinimonas alkaloidigena TaxID=1075417 RepID=A0A1G9HAX9_9BACT|nr:hypothetical protein [Catalinimonas alkaloidigena]SDL09992.1 hypothetical protein SAMN05421823_104374 [Catalinimonas alkaloidigena]
MSQTVIGLFDHEFSAQQAVKELLRVGFLRDNIDLTRHATAGSAKEEADARTDTVLDSLMRFFSALLDDEEEVSRHARAVRHVSSLVVVHTKSSDESRRASEILDLFGAVDVNERAVLEKKILAKGPRIRSLIIKRGVGDDVRLSE